MTSKVTDSQIKDFQLDVKYFFDKTRQLKCIFGNVWVKGQLNAITARRQQRQVVLLLLIICFIIKHSK